MEIGERLVPSNLGNTACPKNLGPTVSCDGVNCLTFTTRLREGLADTCNNLAHVEFADGNQQEACTLFLRAYVVLTSWITYVTPFDCLLFPESENVGQDYSLACGFVACFMGRPRGRMVRSRFERLARRGPAHRDWVFCRAEPLVLELR